MTTTTKQRVARLGFREADSPGIADGDPLDISGILIVRSSLKDLIVLAVTTFLGSCQDFPKSRNPRPQ